MLHWSPKSVQLLIGPDQLTLCECHAAREVSNPVKSPVSGLMSIEDAMRACLTEAHVANVTMNIVVGDAYARYWIVVPPDNASTRSDLRQCMLWRFEELFGDPAGAWNMQADWRAARPFMACALPLALTDAIRSVTSSHRIQIERCVPHFVAEWNKHRGRLRDRDTWFGVSSGSTATVALVQGRQIASVRKMRQPMGEELQPGTIASMLRGTALQHNAAPTEAVFWCGDKPPAWNAIAIEGFDFEWAESSMKKQQSNGSSQISKQMAPR